MRTGFIIGGIVATLILVGAIFISAMVGFVFYSMGHSETAETAKQFLRQNRRLKSDIGEVRDFGSTVTGNINTKNSNGDATLSLKTVGERKTVNPTVSLVYRNGGKWRVVSAGYTNDAGDTINLIEE